MYCWALPGLTPSGRQSGCECIAVTGHGGWCTHATGGHSNMNTILRAATEPIYGRCRCVMGAAYRISPWWIFAAVIGSLAV